MARQHLRLPRRRAVIGVIAAAIALGGAHLPARADDVVGVASGTGRIAYSAHPGPTLAPVAWTASVHVNTTDDERAPVFEISGSSPSESAGGGTGTVTVTRRRLDGPTVGAVLTGAYTRTSATGGVAGSIVRVDASDGARVLTMDLLVGGNQLCGAACYEVVATSVLRTPPEPSSVCDGQPEIFDDTVAGVTIKLRGTAPSSTCVMVEAAGVHLGGRVTVDAGVPSGPPTHDSDAGACGDPATGGHYTVLNNGTFLGGRPHHTSVNRQPDELWVCVIVDTVRVRVVVPTGGEGVGFQPDPIG